MPRYICLCAGMTTPVWVCGYPRKSRYIFCTSACMPDYICRKVGVYKGMYVCILDVDLSLVGEGCFASDSDRPGDWVYGREINTLCSFFLCLCRSLSC